MNKIIISKYQIKENKRESEIEAREKLLSFCGINSNMIERNSLKPKLKDNRLYFNLSHSNGVIGIAISDSEVGFDLEVFRDVDIDKLSRILTNKEKQNLTSNKLLSIFTIKEAYLKYLGIGIVTDLENVIIDYESNIISYKNYRKAYYNQYITDKYVYSVVTENKTDFEVTYEIL